MKHILVLVFLCLILFPLEAQVTFFEPPTYAGNGAVFVADFNGDGKPDILTADGTVNLGKGDGTFTQATSVVSGTPLAVADFTGDGKPDILEQGTGTLLVLPGNGDGTFQAPLSTNSGASLGPIAAADLNGDGKSDLAGVFNNSLVVFLSQGDGTFQPGVSYDLGVTPPAGSLISLGDFNGDGKTDVALSVPSPAMGQEIVLLGNGDGTFQAAKMSSVMNAFSPSSVATGDFDGDGKSDLVINVASGTENVDVFLLGNGDGTFQAAKLATKVIPLASRAKGIVTALDVNGDGKLDLIEQDDATVVQVYFGLGNGIFSNVHSYILSATCGVGSAAGEALTVADFDGDRKPDIAACGLVLKGNGDGTFQGQPIAVVPGALKPNTPGGGVTLATGDFDKDGFVDVAFVSGTNLYVVHNDGTGSGSLTLSHTYTLQQPGSAIVAADLNQDGNLDLAVAGWDTKSTWNYSILLGNGQGAFRAPVFYPQGTASGPPASLVAADFNNDQKPDLAVSTVGNQSLAVLIGNGDGTFAPPADYFNAGGDLVVADLNGDQNLDIASGATGTGTAILFGNGDGTFQAAAFPANLNSFVPIFTADLQNDGKADLVSNGPADGSMGSFIALGRGNGTFNLLADSPGAAAASDFNGDGKLDLFIYQPHTPPSAGSRSAGPGFVGVQLGNGDGTFGPLTNLLEIPAPSSTGSQGVTYAPDTIADMNADGRPDLIVKWPSSLGGIAVITAAGVSLSPGALSPSPVVAGGDPATSTVTISPTFGFHGNVALSCAGLPRGASCAFSPVVVAKGSGTSTLTLTTAASLAAGTYTIEVRGRSGSFLEIAPLALVVQAAPDFTVGVASGSPGSRTITAGQAASFSLSLAGTGSFSGTVNLSCAITPDVTPAPTCNLSSPSVEIGAAGAQPVTVSVGTTAPMTTTAGSTVAWPSGPMWPIFILSGFACLLACGRRKRLSVLAAPALFGVVAFTVSCGGASGSPRQTTIPGTPAGTYTATVTATSGSLSHSATLQVTVH